jgi:hypothetical protein
MPRQVEVQAIRPRIHQRCEPRRAACVERLQGIRVDEQLHAKVTIDLALTLGLCQPPQGVDEVRLDAVEVILGLRIDEPEHCIGVTPAADVSDSPVVTDDRDVLHALLPAVCLDAGRLRRRRGTGDHAQGDQQKLFHELDRWRDSSLPPSNEPDGRAGPI